MKVARQRATRPQRSHFVERIDVRGLTGAGRVFRSRDEQEEAAAYFRQAIDHANKNGLRAVAAQGSTDLALSLVELDRTDEAIAALQKALPILKQAAHPDHRNDPNNLQYANALHSMAYAYDHLGRYDLGEPYHRQALDAVVANVTWNHNLTAVVADDLADSYHMQGRIDEAEEMYKAVITIYESTVGRDHPRCAVAINNLARLLEVEKGQHVEAEKLGREAVAIKRKFFGNDHQQTAVSILNLANILSYQDRDAESEKLTREALAIFEENYGACPSRDHTVPAIAGHLSRQTGSAP